jgi:hypothetical protein
MAYATQTKTRRRKYIKYMLPKQFGLSPNHPANAPMEKALQNLGSKIALCPIRVAPPERLAIPTGATHGQSGRRPWRESAAAIGR